jgi:hypothetical protein
MILSLFQTFLSYFISSNCANNNNIFICHNWTKVNIAYGIITLRAVILT